MIDPITVISRCAMNACFKPKATTAHRMVDGHVEDVDVEAVQVGETILVKPQEVVPVDGTVLAGESLVDEASLTGESKPVAKNAGSDIMSGTVNGDAALTVKVTQRAEIVSIKGLLNWLRNPKRGQHILFGWLIVMRYHLR